ncbi:MAG: ABC transporter substrate-binding protein [Thermodesulfobacteriota bacterium]
MKRPCILAVLFFVIGSGLCVAEEPIRIGGIFLLTGRMSFFGNIARQGAELAVEEINAQGGILGRKLQLVVEDSKQDPVAGREAFLNLVRVDKADVVIGVLDDESAAEIARQAGEHKTVLIVTGAQTDAITGKQCNRFTFRICPNAAQSAKVAALMAARTNAATWTMVGPDNEGSRSFWKDFTRDFGKLKTGGSFAQDSQLVLVTKDPHDWPEIVKKTTESPVQGVLVNLYGGDLVDYMKAGAETDLFDGKREFVVVRGSLAELMALGQRLPEGIWWSAPYWYQASRSPENTDFVAKYEARFGHPPSWHAQMNYTAVKIYEEALKVAGTTQPEAVISALEGSSLDVPWGKLTIRTQDHQALSHAIGGKTLRVSVTGKRRIFRGLGSLVFYRSKEIDDPAQPTDCTMK